MMAGVGPHCYLSLSLLLQVNCDDPQPFCTTYYNYTDISSDLMAVNDSFISISDQIEVVRESETTVTVVMGLGITLAVTYNVTAMIPSFQLTLDPSLTSTMVGLLGSRDGDPSNDLTDKNGAVLDMATATDSEIFDFGNTCKSGQNETVPMDTHCLSLCRADKRYSGLTLQLSRWTGSS